MKLSLKRESVRVLNNNELSDVAGGKVFLIIYNPGNTEGGTYSDCISMCSNAQCDTCGDSSSLQQC